MSSIWKAPPLSSPTMNTLCSICEKKAPVFILSCVMASSEAELASVFHLSNSPVHDEARVSAATMMPDCP